MRGAGSQTLEKIILEIARRILGAFNISIIYLAHLIQPCSDTNTSVRINPPDNLVYLSSFQILTLTCLMSNNVWRHSLYQVLQLLHMFEEMVCLHHHHQLKNLLAMENTKYP